MPSITKQVWEILDNDPTIRKDLERGIINVSALAEYLRATHKIQGSPDSIISAIRRYKGDASVQDDFTRIRHALSEGVVSTKTGLTQLTLHAGTAAAKHIAALVQQEGFARHDVFRIIKSRGQVHVVVDRDTLAMVKNTLPPTAVEETHGSLAEIAIRLTHDGWETKGVLSRVANELSTHGVNIEMVFSVEPTISLVIAQADLVRAHEALMRISGKHA